MPAAAPARQRTPAPLRLLCLLWLTAALPALLGAAAAQAQTTADATPAAVPSATVSGAALGAPERFGRHEDSFVVWGRMDNGGWAPRDEGAARLRYSIKYSLCGTRLAADARAVNPPKDPAGPQFCDFIRFPQRWELFLAYTGEFDFYAGTRKSGPVINRLSMPGIHVRLPFPLPGLGTHKADSLEIGLQHRSNGQVTEVASPRDIERAQRAYDGAPRDADLRHYFDGISRGANFLSVALDNRGHWHDYRLDARVQIKHYLGRQDADITWGPLARSGRSFSDHDRLLLAGSVGWGAFTLSLEWRLGDRLLKTDSQVIGVQWDLWGLPWYLRVHRGPMNTLSNYTQRQDSVGLGLRFARY